MLRSKERFYNGLLEDESSANNGLVFISNESSGFYELCQKFLDIALNSDKVRMEGGGIAGIFKYVDIDVAKAAVIDYANKFDLLDIKPLLSAIEKHYEESLEENEKRPISGMDKASDGHAIIGYYGTFYVFSHINDEIFEKIKMDIIKTFEENMK